MEPINIRRPERWQAGAAARRQRAPALLRARLPCALGFPGGVEATTYAVTRGEQEMAGMQNGEREMADTKHIELRDWFAGQALGAILSNSQYPPQSSGEPFDQFAAKLTDSAYRIAEAMMKQRRRLKKETTVACYWSPPE